MLTNLSIGVDDWQRSEMIEDYYPESLPADWRADFYLNEYRTALVAQSDWSGWDEDWLDELEPAYREQSALYFRIDDLKVIDKSQLEFILDRLGDWVVGFLVFDSDWTGEQTFFNRPVSWINDHQAWSGWHWQNGQDVISGAPCGWVRDLPAELKAQRKILQDFVSSLPEKKSAVPFFVGGESIKMSQLQALKTLSELLGY